MAPNGCAERHCASLGPTPVASAPPIVPQPLRTVHAPCAVTAPARKAFGLQHLPATPAVEAPVMHRGLSPFVLLGAIVAQACSEISTEPRGPAPAGTVTIGMASQLAFVTQALKAAVANTVISPPVRVLLRDSLGNTVAGATDSVTVVLATNPSGAIPLRKVTVAAVDGVATFADLQVDRPGMAHNRRAATPAPDSATSAHARRRGASLPAAESRLPPHMRHHDERRRILLGRQPKRPTRRRDHRPPGDAGARQGRVHLHDAQCGAWTHVWRDAQWRRPVLGRQQQRPAGRRHGTGPRRIPALPGTGTARTWFHQRKRR